jgi:hypothetical protein
MLNSPQDTEEGVERMVAELAERERKRAEYSRRRAFRSDADVDFINSRWEQMVVMVLRLVIFSSRRLEYINCR